MSATAMDNVRSATPGQVRRSPSVPAHWPIRRHVAAAETTPAGPLHSVEVTVPAKTNLTLHVGPAHEEWGGRHARGHDILRHRRQRRGDGDRQDPPTAGSRSN